MDHEVIQNLLSLDLPLATARATSIELPIVIFDAEFQVSHTRLQNPERLHPKLVARLSKDEGWFWGQASILAFLFFQERAKDREVIRSWDDQDRAIHGATKAGF